MTPWPMLAGAWPPIGSVVLYLGAVEGVSHAHNPAWNDPPAASNEPAAEAGSPQRAAILEPGWMVCDGRMLRIAVYPQLHAVIGNRYGAAPNGCFLLPDLRGVFVRGVDDGAGVDPDIDQRRAPDGRGSDAGVGSMQWDALQEHTHGYAQAQTSSKLGQPGSGAYDIAVTQQSEMITAARHSAHESRARNVAVYYVMRCR